MRSALYNTLKDFFKKAIHSTGFDLIRYNVHTSEDVLIKTILHHLNIQTILDVGANEGQYAKKIIEQGFTGNVHSFEPIPSVFKKLQENTKGHSSWVAYNVGLGRRTETVSMNISENFVSSSILKVSSESLSAEPKTRITHQEKINIITLDSFLEQNPNLKKDILLKTDVQGYELEVFNGGMKNLSDIKLIQVELSFTRVYEGGPLFREVLDFLEAQGFEIYTFIPGFLNGQTGRMLQADGILINKKTFTKK